MHKETTTVHALMERHQANKARIQEMADNCEKEKRSRSAEENVEYEQLCRDNQILEMKMHALQTPALPRAIDYDKELRDALYANKKVTIKMVRELSTTEDVEGTGVIPVQQQEMLKPLRAGLIWDKVGLHIATGLRGGTLRWPRHGKAQAQWAKEGERLEDSSIDWNKLETQPERLGCPIPVTREALKDSAGIVESVVREEMPAAVVDLVNDALFTTTDKYLDKAGKQQTRVLYGPFVEAAKDPFVFAGELPTRKELLLMKSKVVKTGIKLVGPCWVMTEDMKAQLEDVKVDAGSGRFLCENDHILGYPVFCTNSIGDGNVGFGDWAYQAAGFFDSMNIIVDPYTLARQNAVDFVLNARFGTVTLYPEAFVLGKATAAADDTEEGDNSNSQGNGEGGKGSENE